MSPKYHVTKPLALAAAVATAVAAPAAAAQPQDLRGADATGAPSSAQVERHSYRDLRGADAKGAPTAAQAERHSYRDLRGADAKGAPTQPNPDRPTYRDLRSPDAIDAGREILISPPDEVSEAKGFDWGDAGIGAASIFALLLAGLGTLLLVAQRRGRSVGSTVAN